MTLINAIILGIIQGLTEFFPISSSAHLQLAKTALGISENLVFFDLACHLGTLAALSWFLKKDIRALFSTERSKIRLYFLALLPLIPAYFLLGPLRDFASKPHFLGIFLIGTALILFLGQRLRLSRIKNNILRAVLIIGAMQSTALFPGISRSASTISCAQILGWNPKNAVRFSFLLSIPTILGGGCDRSQKTASNRKNDTDFSCELFARICYIIYGGDASHSLCNAPTRRGKTRAFCLVLLVAGDA